MNVKKFIDHLRFGEKDCIACIEMVGVDGWPDSIITPYTWDDSTGRTPLHYSSWRGEEELTKSFLSLGMSPDAKDYEGLTPYDLAEENDPKKRDRIISILDGNFESPFKLAIPVLTNRRKVLLRLGAL